MRRRWGKRCAGAAIAVAAFCLAAPAGVGGPGAVAAARRSPEHAGVRVLVSAKGPGRPIPPGFIGLSFEYWAVPAYAGLDARAVNPVLVELIRGVTPGGGFVLRVGGDSTDSTWWPVPGEARPGGVGYSLGPDWLATVHALLAATDGKAVLGVNLESDRPKLATAEARAFLSGIGRNRIVALEIGNEPEQYRFRRHYIRRFSRWRRLLPRVPVAGPATGSVPWLARFLAAERGVRLVTLHRYGLSDCITARRSPRYPSVARLLAPATARRLVDGVGRYVEIAHRRRAAFRIDELNSVTCQGEAGVSNSFASALWMLESLFEAASIGVDGVNVHVWPGAAPNQLFTFERRGGHWLGAVRPAYYALVMFTDAAPPGSRLLRTRVTGAAPVSSWATLAPNGEVRVALINTSRRRARSVTVQLHCRSGSATLRRLQATSPYATTGVSLGGQTVEAATGRLAGSPELELLRASAGGYRVRLPAASAAVLDQPRACARLY